MGLVSNQLRRVHVKRDSRKFLVGNAASLEELPGVFAAVTEPFALLLAMDATCYSDEQILAAADTVAARGLVYLCAWGQDCERVHDLFDRAARPYEKSRGASFQQLIMTTWHDDQPLSEACWYLQHCALPTDESILHRYECIGMSVDNHLWRRRIEYCFTRRQRLS